MVLKFYLWMLQKIAVENVETLCTKCDPPSYISQHYLRIILCSIITVLMSRLIFYLKRVFHIQSITI
jgi:hypothetical protein